MSGTNSGPELLLGLDRDAGRTLRAQLEDGLRDAVRSGRLSAGSRLPATRALAADLSVSRRLVVDAYAQLLAEGYLRARQGAGTFVAAGARAPDEPMVEAPPPRPTFDFFPGHPDLAGFPRAEWLRAVREILRGAPDRAFGYPDPQGAPELRAALAAHLRRVRGVAADPRCIVICSGAGQGFGLVARTLSEPRIAVEDPMLPVHRMVLASQGAALLPLPVDDGGARVSELPVLEEAEGSIDAVLVTPAHQSSTGVSMTPARRAELLEWAAGADAVVIEDDYDAEFRYDRAPLAAIQGLAPEHVVYLGTASKTLAPALRLGWLVLPPRMVEPLVGHKLLADMGCPTVDQLALARLLESGAYDRHLRAARRRYRARRDALIGALARHLPAARVTGVAAGLHAHVHLGVEVDSVALVRAAAARGVGVYPLSFAYMSARQAGADVVLGYASLAEPAIEEGIRRLAGALEELAPGPAVTNDGGAISR